MDYVVKFRNYSQVNGERGRRMRNNGQFVAVDYAQARMIADTIDGAEHETHTAHHETRALIFVRVHVTGPGSLLIHPDDMANVAEQISAAATAHRENVRQVGPEPSIRAAMHKQAAE